MQVIPVQQTLVFERKLSATPSAVFAAYADARERAKWSAPSPTAAVVYASTDFQVGGADHFRCGSVDDLRFAGVVQYLDIVAEQRIVYSEVISAAGARLSVSLVTWEMRPNGESTHLVVTAHVVSFVGDDIILGTRDGMNGALDNFGRLVDGGDGGMHVAEDTQR
jgi:uncharacterized protein YndB with AHSA1/START domain